MNTVSFFLKKESIQFNIYFFFYVVKQTVQKEEDFKYQIDELRKANHELYTQMIIEGEFEDDDEPISETPEETYTCRSSVNSSPVLFNYPLMASYEKTGKKKTYRYVTWLTIFDRPS